MAKEQNKGIALENLTGIRKSANNKGKVFRSRIGKWNFSDLRAKIEYKTRLAGIPVILVPPAYTSKMCNRCLHIGSRNGESFKCSHCNLAMDADINGAKNIHLVGQSLTLPEKSSSLSCSLAA